MDIENKLTQMCDELSLYISDIDNRISTKHDLIKLMNEEILELGKEKSIAEKIFNEFLNKKISIFGEDEEDKKSEEQEALENKIKKEFFLKKLKQTFPESSLDVINIRCKLLMYMYVNRSVDNIRTKDFFNNTSLKDRYFTPNGILFHLKTMKNKDIIIELKSNTDYRPYSIWKLTEEPLEEPVEGELE